MSFIDDSDNDNNHWHDPSCDHYHRRARPLDSGAPVESLQQYASRTARVANDPRRIQARKRIAPAFTVPRLRTNLA
ncbi:hypothetical protein BJ956_000531 [Arthrobacter psychrochitiniphilus]|nr:hypothetical protein [Arthrobacter psychrochitiniphilus]